MLQRWDLGFFSELLFYVKFIKRITAKGHILTAELESDPASRQTCVGTAVVNPVV